MALKNDSLREQFFQVLAIIEDAWQGPVGKDVGVAMGKYHDVSRNQLDAMGAVLDFASSPSLGEKVIDDDMFGPFAKKCRDFVRRRRAEPPRRCEFGLVEHRPFKLYRLEDFRESVHRTSDSDF